jgi:hypothetical protein
MVVDLAAHRPRLADHGVGEIVRLRGRGVHDDGQRGLQRVREVAGVASCLLGLAFVVLDQGVELLDHRRDLDGHRARHAGRLPGAHPRDLLADAAQGPQAVEGLQRGKQQQPDREQREAAHQGPSQYGDLRIEPVAALRDLEPPMDRRTGQHHVAFDDAELLVGELRAVVDVQVAVVMRAAMRETAIPERARREILAALARHLPVESRARFDEALVGGLAGEDHLALGPDLRRIEQRAQHIDELVVEIARHRRREHPVEREPAAGEQDEDPHRRDQDHAARQRALGRHRGADDRFGLGGGVHVRSFVRNRPNAPPRRRPGPSWEASVMEVCASLPLSPNWAPASAGEVRRGKELTPRGLRGCSRGRGSW